MFLFPFLNHSLALSNSCSYCTNFNPIAELLIPIEILIKEGKVDIQMHPVIKKVK